MELSLQDGLPASEIAQLLAASDLLKTLQLHELERVARSFHIKTYRAEQTVIAQDSEGSDVYCLANGCVRATLYSPTGREISYQELLAGDFFGELSAIDDGTRSTHVIANEESRVLVINKLKFIEILQDYPQVSMAVMQKMAGLIRFLAGRVYEFSALDVNCRVRSELIRMAETKGVVLPEGVLIEVMPTHQEFASRIATHREAVMRELNRMVKADLITRKGKGFLIANIDQLKSMVQKG